MSKQCKKCGKFIGIKKHTCKEIWNKNKTKYNDKKVKNISILRAIFNIIYNNPGQIIELTDLSNELGINRQTLSIIFC